MSEKELLESLEAIINSEEFSINTNPIKIDGSLCIKCGGYLAGYCILRNMDAPYTNYCIPYYPKK